MAKVERLDIRSLLNVEPEYMWTKFGATNDKVIIVCDDGEVKTTYRRVVYCSVIWRLFNIYPKAPILKVHTLEMDRLTTARHLELMGQVYKSIYTAYSGDASFDKHTAWRHLYQVTNSLYNESICYLDRYVETLNILDLLHVVDNPVIKGANAVVQPTQKSIDETYDVIKSTLESDKRLKGNALANAVRAKMLDNKQVNQCIGPRGFVTEIESTIYPIPITVGYVEGMHRLYDSMVESRSASKSLMFQKDPLQESEYFNRTLQIYAQVVRHLAVGDCGTTHTMSWFVEGSELRFMDGVHYVENGVVKTIHKTDQHLVGKTINLRTPFGCITPNRQTVCETCYGEISHSIPVGVSPGHVAAISIGEKISQLVMSIKHVDGSSAVDAIILGEEYDKYLTPGSDNCSLRIASGLKGKKIRIVIPSKYADRLLDVRKVTIDDTTNIKNFSELPYVTFLIGSEEDEDGLLEVRVPTAMGARRGSLTQKALIYIKHQGITLDEKGDYVVDLSQWEQSVALFKLPLKHLNMLDFQNSVKKFILSISKSKDDKVNAFTLNGKISSREYATPVEAIKAFHALVTSKVDINLSHTICLAYAVSAVDPKNFNFHLPKGGEDFSFVESSRLMNGRSLSAYMAYERQEKPFKRPTSYIFKDRPSHPMDNLLLGR